MKVSISSMCRLDFRSDVDMLKVKIGIEFRVFCFMSAFCSPNV